MSAFLYGVVLQWKLDFRNKGVLLTYYVVPLVFFAFMGGIFPATWGFKLMTGGIFDIGALIPLAIIMLAAVCVSWYKLYKISSN
jgi:hypothetical protein